MVFKLDEKEYSLQEETSALERDTSVPESPYAIIAKTSNRRKAAPEKPPLSNRYAIR